MGLHFTLFISRFYFLISQVANSSTEPRSTHCEII